jgi:hypothetical protein
VSFSLSRKHVISMFSRITISHAQITILCICHSDRISLMSEVQRTNASAWLLCGLIEIDQILSRHIWLEMLVFQEIEWVGTSFWSFRRNDNIIGCFAYFFEVHPDNEHCRSTSDRCWCYEHLHFSRWQRTWDLELDCFFSSLGCSRKNSNIISYSLNDLFSLFIQSNVN